MVCFHPWAAAALLGGASASLLDRLESLDAVAGRSLSEMLAGRLREAKSPDERVRIIEDALAGLLRPDIDRLVAACARTIYRNWGRLGVSELARRCSLRRRQLNRRFTRAAGIGPKKFSSLVRFQKASDACGTEEIGSRR